MTLSKNLENKLNNLILFLKNKKVIVAFSGGVDSSLLAFLSKKFAKEIILVTEHSILYPEEEIEKASQFAQKYQIPHVILESDPLLDENFTTNPINRCYICKKSLYSEVIKIMNDKKFDLILDGSNLDDLEDYRPGMQAIKELNVNTPYIEFKINKQEIREISKYYNLEVQSKPSMACLASRIPYGQIVNKERLELIKKGEEFIKKNFGLNQVRVRLHEGNLARIEFLIEDFPKILTLKNLKLISHKFKEMGFCYVTIDIEGFRSGSLNEILSLNK